MKKILPVLLIILALTMPGCAWMKRHTPWHHSAHNKSAPAPVASTNAPPPAAMKPAPAVVSQPIVTPDDSLAAKVLSVNAVGRFVVLNFPNGHLPDLGQHMFLYRAGLKTAEVKIVGPQQDTSIVADIISGDAQAGDIVREQ